MSLTVNTNVASLNAQHNLASNQTSLVSTLQRLSSGLRVNNAKDDAAGMAVAEAFTSQIRGSNQAVRNSNDGISLGQTAESALGQLANNLQRVREISVQAANGTISNSNRGQLQLEVDQLTQEISRIVQTTQFNGTSLLSGASTVTFQVGADGASNNQIRVATTDLTAVASGNAAQYAAAQAIVNVIAASPSGNGSRSALIQGEYAVDVYPGVQVVTNRTTTLTSSANVYNSTDAASAATIATYYAAQTVYNSGGGQTGGVTQAQLVAAAQAVANSYQPSNPTLNSYNSNLAGTSTIDVSTQSNASGALAKLDADIAQISTTRSTFGAVQNRFEAVIYNLQKHVENISASRSRIVDADFALEAGNLTRGQILQQVATAVLAQANSLPQTALSLLR
jgi:flagellin